jgi:hypothetical protein
MCSRNIARMPAWIFHRHNEMLFPRFVSHLCQSELADALGPLAHVSIGALRAESGSAPMVRWLGRLVSHAVQLILISILHRPCS